MLYYVVVLLLINTYSSLSLPVTNRPVSIAASLERLASQCTNKYVSKIIMVNLGYCNDSMKLHSKHEMMCLMFYDINRQLCERNHSEDLNDDAINKITETQERKSLCDSAQTWTFGNLPEYPEYKQLASIIFKNQDKCISACAVVDDIVSDDSNYYCKYFKWGIDILKEQKVTDNPKPNVIKNDSKSNNSITSTITNASPNVGQEETKEEVKISTSNITSEPIQVSGGEVLQKSVITPSLSVATPDSNSKDGPKQLEEIPTKKGVEEQKDNGKGIIERPFSDDKEISKENLKSKPISAGVQEDQEDDDEHEEDGMLDTIGANEQDEDQSFNSDPKIDLDKTNSNEKKIEAITSFNGDISQRAEIFPNTIQDTFSEDDDHFFPFFMTAIIVVVLLYILYHNKSKFTKVILGLIVEGRQSGRRRNSRGHAYRRLDTLEQAMSSNTAAPPSKIIY